MHIELSATKNFENGDVARVDVEEADQFSVYVCDPYADWTADFKHYADALNWAEEVADNYNCELINNVTEET